MRPALRPITRRQAEALGHAIVLVASGRRVTCRALAERMGLTAARTRYHVERLYLRGYLLRPGFPVDPAPWVLPRVIAAAIGSRSRA